MVSQITSHQQQNAGGTLSDGVLQIVLWIGGVGVAIIGALTGALGTLALRNMNRRDAIDDGRERDQSRSKDKQGAQGEALASVTTRIGALEDGFTKLADALQRIARLEEWRNISSPRLDDAEETARAVVGLAEQTKTIFKRMDATDDKIDDLRREQADMPRETARQTAELLRTMIKPIERRVA